MVPIETKRRFHATFRRGQWQDVRPTRENTRAIMEAVAAVAQAEGGVIPWWVELGWDREVANR